MNKTRFCSIVLVTVFVGFVCICVYSSIPIETEPKAVIPLPAEEDIIVVYKQRLEGTYYTNIVILHDNERNVTCWQTGNGISCIPDYILEETER